jgi:hypothetical protein
VQLLQSLEFFILLALQLLLFGERRRLLKI